MTPRVNLCLHNHLRTGIIDQIWFAQQAFRQAGYELLCTNTLRPDCLNLLIENFVEEDALACEAFCKKYNKQIGIVMTEHIELVPDDFTFNGASLHDFEYIANKEQRLFGLLSLMDSTFGFFTLGELPELNTWSKIMPGRRIHRVPYPAIDTVPVHPRCPEYDVVFTGFHTPYRVNVLDQIQRSFRVALGRSLDNETTRSRHYAAARIAVNIPQSAEWKWISPMRILYGLRVGVPTVHLGERDATLFSRLVLEPIDLDTAVEEYEALFGRQFDSYQDFVASRYNFSFPSGVFDAWAKLELLD